MKSILFLFLFCTGVQLSAQDSLRGEIIRIFKIYKDRPVNLTEEEAIQILVDPGSKMIVNSVVNIEASSQWYPFSGDLIQYTAKQEVWFDGVFWQYGDTKVESSVCVMNTFGKFAYYLFIGFLILCPYFLERNKYIDETKSRYNLVDKMLYSQLDNAFKYLIDNSTFWIVLFSLLAFDKLLIGIPALSSYIIGLLFSVGAIYYWRSKKILFYGSLKGAYFSPTDMDVDD